MNLFDRRSFLLASGALVLAACGSDSGGSAKDSAGPGADTPDGGYILALRSPTDVLVPGRARLAFSLADSKRLLSDGPATLTGRIGDIDGNIVIPDISAGKRQVTDALVYWDFHPQLDKTGVYTLFIDGGTADGGAFQINDPASMTLPFVGETLPGLDTPTTADHRGVEPICTRLDGQCPFHEMTLTDALATGKPVAYIIGTPAHCQIGSCAPGLEALIATSKRLGDKLAVVHAEVYVDDKAVVTTDAINMFNLVFEPLVFVTNSAGVIQARLDALWDQTELDEVIDTVV